MQYEETTRKIAGMEKRQGLPVRPAGHLWAQTGKLPNLTDTQDFGGIFVRFFNL